MVEANEKDAMRCALSAISCRFIPGFRLDGFGSSEAPCYFLVSVRTYVMTFSRS